MPKRKESVSGTVISADLTVISEGTTVHIVYDTLAREYYNKRTDFYLSEDDISFYGLKTYNNIPTPLPLEAKQFPKLYFFQRLNIHDISRNP